MARIVDPRDSPSRMLGDVPSQPGRTPVRAASEPLRLFRHRNGAWLGVKVEQGWTVESTYEVFVGRGHGDSGTWGALGVPINLYEDALALALSMHAQLVEHFAAHETLKDSRSVRA